MKRGAVMVGTSALLVCLLGTPQRWAFAQVPPPGSAPPPDSAPAPEGSITAESEPAPPASAEAMEPTALEELLAPIALYPDTLLGAMFGAASRPQEVMDAGNWRLENKSLVGKELDTAAQTAGFGPAARTLLAFPSVLDMMCQNFDWTKQLGSAFNADQTALMAAVQRLRTQAVERGNLKSTPEQKVEQRVVNEQTVVEIRPVQPRVVYVPQYNPEAVYTVPAPTTVQYVEVPGEVGVTEVVASGGIDSGDVLAAGLIGFSAGIVLANLFSDDRPSHGYSYYERYHCPYPRWGYGYLYFGDRPWFAGGYRYRPNYFYGGYRPGYRPGWGYRPPRDYPHVWTRPAPWQRPPTGYGPQVVVNVHNTQVNYFNRFGDNHNQLAPNRPRPALVAPPVRKQVNTHYRPQTRPPQGLPVPPPVVNGRPQRPQQDLAPAGAGQRPAPPLGVGGGRPQTVPPVGRPEVQNKLPPNARPGVPPVPTMFGQQPAGRPTNAPDWKGQTSYQGALPGVGGGRPQMGPPVPPVKASEVQQKLPPKARPAVPPVPAMFGQQPSGRPTNAPDWKGQTTYQGALPGVGGGRPQTGPPVPPVNGPAVQQTLPPKARPSVPAPPPMFGQQPGGRPANAPDWKGQSGYQGAYPGVGGGRPQTVPPVTEREVQQKLPATLRPSTPYIPPAVPAGQGWRAPQSSSGLNNAPPPSYQRPQQERPVVRPAPPAMPQPPSPAASFQRPAPAARPEPRPTFQFAPESRPGPPAFRPAPAPVAPPPRPEVRRSAPPVMSAPPRPEPRQMPIPQSRPEPRQAPQSSGNRDPRAYAKPGQGKSREDLR